MKNFMNKLKSVPALAIFLILDIAAALLFYACRPTWVFVGVTVGFSAFPLLLLGLFSLLAVISAVLTALKIYKGSSVTDKKAYSAVLITDAVLSVIAFIVAIAFSAGHIADESREVYLLYLKESFPVASVIIITGFLALFFPALNCKAKKAVSAFVLSFVTVLGVCNFVPLTPYKITSVPMVIDNGEGYSIVFSTSGYGTGYIEYTYEGKDYKVYDQTGGRLNADGRIHSMSVPYEHLQNNSYKVGSVRIIEQYSYGSRSGKEVVSDEYTFSYKGGADRTFLVISDWHTMLDEAYDAISYLGDYDSVILLGDSSPGVDFEDQIIRNVIQFGGQVSGGTKPVLYVRGNHETRGAYAGELMTALGLESFYYKSETDPYTFIVLDSGEDKDDSHIEYGGMTDYNTSRAEMIKWLEGTKAENKKVITLSHSWEISDVEEDLSLAGWDEIDRIGTRLIISGHTHQCRLIGKGSEKEEKIFSDHSDIIGYMDGGKSGDIYTASKLTLSDDGFELTAYNNLGEKVFGDSFGW